VKDFSIFHSAPLSKLPNKALVELKHRHDTDTSTQVIILGNKLSGCKSYVPSDTHSIRHWHAFN